MSDWIDKLPEGAVLLYGVVTAVSAFIGWLTGSIKNRKKK